MKKKISFVFLTYYDSTVQEFDPTKTWTKARSKVKKAKLESKSPSGIRFYGCTLLFPTVSYGLLFDFNLWFYAI